jgi:hypothetical protein
MPTFTPRRPYHRRKYPKHLLDRGWVDPGSDLEAVEQREMSNSCPFFDELSGHLTEQTEENQENHQSILSVSGPRLADMKQKNNH